MKIPNATRNGRSGWLSLGGTTSIRWLLSLIPCVLILAAAARTHVRVGDWASDLSLFSTAVRDSPESYLAHLNYASALSSSTGSEADLGTALAHYVEALELAPTNYRIPYDLGNLYIALGRLDDAETAYLQALALYPNLPQARLNLGNILAQKGNLEGALAQFEAAETLLPRAPAPKVNRAHVLQMLGRPAEAIPLYRQALALEPGLLAALQGLARATETLALGLEDSGSSR